MFKKIIFFLLLIFIYSCSHNQTKPFSNWKDPITEMEFILLPKGSFLMGDSKANETDRQHKVTISENFWMGKTEVTQKQWSEIMGNEEIHPEKPSLWRNSNPQYPVVSISYTDVQHFIEKLNKISKTSYFRLPTEAEWEYACRSGTVTPFSYGDRISDSLVNFNAKISSAYSIIGDYLAHPEPVGSYPPNQWGLYDMHGNVWEWVSDWYASYPKSHIIDPRGPQNGEYKIIRGGSWHYGAQNARSSSRRTHEPNLWGFSIGFRLVREKKDH